jgi:hypothetical protein
MALVPEDMTLVALTWTRKPTGRGYRGQGCMLSRVTRKSYNGLIGTKSYSPMAIETGERIGVDQARV